MADTPLLGGESRLPIPWTSRIKHHPIFDQNPHQHPAFPWNMNSTQPTHTANASTLHDDITCSSRFGNSSFCLAPTQPNLAVFDPLLHASHFPRNLLAVMGHIMAVIVDGELRILSLLAVKHALQLASPSASVDRIRNLLTVQAPYWRVQFNNQHDPSSSLSEYTSSWLQLQFNQSSRFLAMVSSTRILVVDFNTLLPRVSDFHNTSLRTTAVPALDPTTTPPTLHATLLELGRPDLSLGSSSSLILQCAWHPLAKNWTDLVVLTGAGELRVYSVLVTIDYPLHSYLILDDRLAHIRSSPMFIGELPCAVPVAFCLGLPLTSMLVDRVVKPVAGARIVHLRPELVWMGCTAFVAMNDGSIRTVCPVLPLLWSVSLYDYKCMRASLVTLQSTYPSPKAVPIRALARFLHHIDHQIPIEHRAQPLKDVSSEKRYSEAKLDEADASPAEELVFDPTDLTTTLVIEAPEYKGITSTPLPLVLAPNAPPTCSMLDPLATCCDIAFVFAEPAGHTPPAGQAHVPKTIQVPVLVVAYETGAMDVLVPDTVWPTWGTRVTLSSSTQNSNSFSTSYQSRCAPALEWVTPSAGAPSSVLAFASETIQLLGEPSCRANPTSMLRIMLDPVVSGQIIVTHVEGVHQIVVRLGAPSIAQHVVDTSPLKILEKGPADPNSGRNLADERSRPNENDASLPSFVHISAGDTFDEQLDQEFDAMTEGAVIGCIALGDPMLDHAVILVTRTEALAGPLYILNLDMVGNQDGNNELNVNSLPSPTREVLDITAPFKTPIQPLSLAALADIPDTYPVVSKLRLPEATEGGVHEKQIEYVATVTNNLCSAIKPLSQLVDQLKTAMATMQQSVCQAEKMVQSVTYSGERTDKQLGVLETRVHAATERASAVLQVLHDLRNPSRLTVAERKFRSEVVHSINEAKVLHDRVAKVCALRPSFVEWAQRDADEREDRFGGLVSMDQQNQMERLLNAQYVGLNELEGMLHAMGAVVSRAADPVESRCN